ncbi:F-box and WD-40 domain protein 1/11 [Rhodotorula toruloides]|uniref:F-box and WD-40 domain protein 1/11 n=1 Tax=Rhodotorula toruloides TaxID=5286 RepID=A0A511K7R7_RHOTO|nr:F-box and WD-40 domain protein 1/11 [Rhodotorula toruloides]
MPWKGKEKDNSPLESNILGYDDEACFVDGLEGKVDFLASLPSEISLHILTHLDFCDVLSVSLVSRQWRNLALDPLLWRDLFHQNPRWHIKPEAYRAAAQAAQAAQAAAIAAKEAASASSNGASTQQASDRPVMPNLKRAASSFGRAGAKRLVTGADKVSHGGTVIGRKLSEIVGDFGGLSLVPGMATAPSSRATSRTPSEAGDVVMEPSQIRPPIRPSPNRRPAGSTPLLSLSSAGTPSLSTLQTNAFASPPSASLSRNNSSSALSSLTSALPNSLSTPRRNSAAPPSFAPSTPPPTSRPRLPSSPYSNTPRPAAAEFDELTDPAGAASLYLDWPRLYRDRWLLERRWQRGKPSWSWFEGHTDSVYCIQFDERKIISGSRDQTVRIWDIASGTIIHTLTGHEGSVLCLQYDASILVTGSSDSRVIVWDLVGEEATGKGRFEQMMTLVGHAMGVLDLCFDDKWIVSCSKDTTTRVWDRSTGELYRVLQGHRGPVNAVQLHGEHALTASGDALMKLWDIHTGQTIRTFSGHSRGLACVHWAPSGTHFVSSSNDKTIKLWNAETGECVRTFVGHTDLVRGLAYDEKSQMIVSGGYDRSTRVWDAETGREIHKFKSHASLVFDVAFDASRIISSSHDKRILLMNFGVGLDVDKFA